MKRMVCLMLALFMLSMPGACALIAVNGSFSALVTENGENICIPGVFSGIFKITEELYSVRSADTDKFSLMTKGGEMLTESKFSLFHKIADNAILFQQDGKYGVMDEKANVVVPNEYTWLVSNGAGGYLALRTDVWDNSPDGVYLIGENGYVSPTGVKVASFLMDFSEGLSPALSTDNGKYGYLNPEGQWEIRPQYAYADAFSGGFAVATLDSGSGVIDKKGSWQITPKYDFVDIGSENGLAIACVDYEGSVAVFSKETFDKIYSFDQDLMGAYVAISGNSVVAYFEDRVTEFDLNGNEIASVSPEGYLFPIEGGYTIGDENVYLTFVKGNETVDSYRVGVVDQTGREILASDYTSVIVPEKGFLQAENENGMYLFTLKGELIWAFEY